MVRSECAFEKKCSVADLPMGGLLVCERLPLNHGHRRCGIHVMIHQSRSQTVVVTEG